MGEMDQLYREVILDHYKNPRSHGLLPDADVEAEGQNPLCGDEVTVSVKFAEDGETMKLRDIAVLYRTNAQSRAIEEACLRYGIRYQVVGGTRFYSRREVKDALAYLRVLRSDADQVSFERVINVPARSIGDKTIAVIRAYVAREGVPFWLGLERAAEGEVGELAGRARAAVADFVGLIRRLRSRVGVLPLPELLDDLLDNV